MSETQDSQTEIQEPETDAQENSTTARLQILNHEDGSTNLDFIWPNEEGVPQEQLDEEGAQAAGFVEVDSFEQSDLDTLIALQGLDYKLEGDIRLVLNQIATAVWERAKIEFKGE